MKNHTMTQEVKEDTLLRLQRESTLVGMFADALDMVFDTLPVDTPGTDKAVGELPKTSILEIMSALRGEFLGAYLSKLFDKAINVQKHGITPLIDDDDTQEWISEALVEAYDVSAPGMAETLMTKVLGNLLDEEEFADAVDLTVKSLCRTFEYVPSKAKKKDFLSTVIERLQKEME